MPVRTTRIERAARGEAGGEPVARARAETGSDVQAGGHRVEQHAGSEHGPAQPERVRHRSRAEDQVDDGADHHDVRRGAEPGALPQRDPQQQHQHADEDQHGADRDAGDAGKPGVEHVPRIDADARREHQRLAHAVEAEPEDQLREPHGAPLPRPDPAEVRGKPRTPCGPITHCAGPGHRAGPGAPRVTRRRRHGRPARLVGRPRDDHSPVRLSLAPAAGAPPGRRPAGTLSVGLVSGLAGSARLCHPGRKWTAPR